MTLPDWNTATRTASTVGITPVLAYRPDPRGVFGHDVSDGDTCCFDRNTEVMDNVTVKLLDETIDELEEIAAEE